MKSDKTISMITRDGDVAFAMGKIAKIKPESKAYTKPTPASIQRFQRLLKNLVECTPPGYEIHVTAGKYSVKSIHRRNLAIIQEYNLKNKPKNGKIVKKGRKKW